MKLLTPEAYQSRLDELTSERVLAEEAYQSACFALEIGSGSEEEVSAAKTRRELVESKLAGLGGAWRESQRLAAIGKDENHEKAYRTMLSDVDRGLQARGKAMSAIEEAAAELGVAVAEYRAATSTVRSAAFNYVRSYERNRDISLLDSYLSGGAVSFGLVVGTLLEAQALHPAELGADRSLLAGRTASQLEQHMAEKVREHAARYSTFQKAAA